MCALLVINLAGCASTVPPGNDGRPPQAVARLVQGNTITDVNQNGPVAPATTAVIDNLEFERRYQVYGMGRDEGGVETLTFQTRGVRFTDNTTTHTEDFSSRAEYPVTPSILRYIEFAFPREEARLTATATDAQGNRTSSQELVLRAGLGAFTLYRANGELGYGHDATPASRGYGFYTIAASTRCIENPNNAGASTILSEYVPLSAAKQPGVRQGHSAHIVSFRPNEPGVLQFRRADTCAYEGWAEYTSQHHASRDFIPIRDPNNANRVIEPQINGYWIFIPSNQQNHRTNNAAVTLEFRWDMKPASP